MPQFLDSGLIHPLAAWALGLSMPALFATVVGIFLALYVGFALVGVGIRGQLLPSMGRGHPLYPEGPRPGQLRAEVRRSLVTVGVFGLLGLFSLWAAKQGIITVRFSASWPQIALDWVLVFLWNELHFYTSHRSLHAPWLMKSVHRVHHLSRVPTPWSTYSFHWFEALLLGSVMFCAMLLRDFHFSALLFLPVLSIAVNVIGHLNYEPFPGSSPHGIRSMARRHGLHHEKYTTHYGFLTPWLDDFFGTGMPKKKHDIAVPVLVRGTWRYVSGFVLVTLTTGAYLWTNHHSLTDPYLVAPTLIERSIPVISWTAWIYVTYPLIFLAAYVSETHTPRLHAYFYAIVAVNLVSEVCFVLFPTTIPRFDISTLANDDSTGAALLRAVHAIDTPKNCVPSLHVSTSVLAALVVMERKHRALSIFFWVWAGAISLSTLTTHQHHLVDVLCGAGLAWACFVFCRDRLAVPNT